MHGIIASIWPETQEHLGVIVANGSYVELLHPARLCVHHPEIIEESATELPDFFFIRIHPDKHFL